MRWGGKMYNDVLALQPEQQGQICIFSYVVVIVV